MYLLESCHREFVEISENSAKYYSGRNIVKRDGGAFEKYFKYARGDKAYKDDSGKLYFILERPMTLEMIKENMGMLPLDEESAFAITASLDNAVSRWFISGLKLTFPVYEYDTPNDVKQKELCDTYKNMASVLSYSINVILDKFIKDGNGNLVRWCS